MTRARFFSRAGWAVCLLLAAQAASGRDHVLAVGSSTVYPFATIAAEHIGRGTKIKTPRIEAWGSGGGLRLFCNGVGAKEVDIAFASRKIAANEWERCERNGVTEILELRLGWDGIVFAASRKGPPLPLTLQNAYLALALQVPDPTEVPGLVPNPYRRWSEIDGALPDLPIHFYGPPTTSGTRDVLVEQVLIASCRGYAWLSKLERANPAAFRKGCSTIREDGGYTSTGENDNLIVRKVSVSDHAVGIFGFSYYDQNRDKLQASKIDGIEPTHDSIYDREYPLARPLFMYVKGAHLDSIPGLRPFVREILSERAAGAEGYLVERGLIPLPEAEREANARKIANQVSKR